MDLAELTRMYDFTGKSIAITGGAGVLGGEMACALVGCGANVVILDRDLALTQRLIQRFEPTASGRAIVVYGDVLKRDTLEQAREVIMHEFGQLDGLINAAGGNRPDATTAPDRSFFDLPEEVLRCVFDLT